MFKQSKKEQNNQNSQNSQNGRNSAPLIRNKTDYNTESLSQLENVQLLNIVETIQQKLSVSNIERAQLKKVVEECKIELFDAKHYAFELEGQLESIQSEFGHMKDKQDEAESYLSESNVLKRTLRTLRDENKALKQNIKELKQENKNLVEAYKGSAENATGYSLVVDKLNQTENDFDSLRSIHAQTLQDLYDTQQERDILLKSCQTMECRIVELENERRDNLEIIDAAQKITQENLNQLTDDKGNNINQMQLQSEIQRLQSRIKDLRDGYGESLLQEIQRVQSIHQDELNQMVQQLTDLEIKNANLISEMGRLDRDKNTLERESIAKLQTLENQIARSYQEIDELNSRIQRLVVERDNSLHNYEQISHKMEQYRNQIESDRFVQTEDTIMKRQRLSQLEHENTSLKTQVCQETKIIHELQQQIESYKNDLRDQHSKNQQFIEKQEVSFIDKVRAMDESYERIKSENRKLNDQVQLLLNEQSKTSRIWKDESQSIKQKYQAIIDNLQMENKSLQQKLDELLQNMEQVTSLKDEINTQHKTDLENLQKMSLLLEASNSKNKNLSLQIQELIQREHDLIKQKKELQHNYDRIVLERKRLCNDKKEKLYQSLNIDYSKSLSKSQTGKQPHLRNVQHQENDLTVDAL